MTSGADMTARISDEIEGVLGGARSMQERSGTVLTRASGLAELSARLQELVGHFRFEAEAGVSPGELSMSDQPRPTGALARLKPAGAGPRVGEAAFAGVERGLAAVAVHSLAD